MSTIAVRALTLPTRRPALFAAAVALISAVVWTTFATLAVAPVRLTPTNDDCTIGRSVTVLWGLIGWDGGCLL